MTIVDAQGRVYRQVYGENFDLPMLVGPLKELVTGAPTPCGTVATFVERVRILCTVYDPRLGRYRLDYGLFVEIFAGLSVLGAVLWYLARELAPAAYTQGIVSPVQDSPAAGARPGAASVPLPRPRRPGRPSRGVELVCPAGSLPALKVAVDNGADYVYIGFRRTRPTPATSPASTSTPRPPPTASATRTHAAPRCWSRSTPTPSPAVGAGRRRSISPPTWASTR